MGGLDELRISDLEEQRDDLLIALKGMLNAFGSCRNQNRPTWTEAIDLARAEVAKAEHPE